MKQEIKEVIVKHPKAGDLKKTVLFTYDETKYKTLDECISDHEAMEAELKAEREKLTKENEKIVEDSKKQHEQDVQKYNDAVLALQKEYAEKLKALKQTEPVYKHPELKRVDSSKYEGRGYVNKENYVQPEKTLVEIIKDASPEEIAKLKELLK